MGSSYGAGFSQLFLELVDAYRKRFMPQNWQVVLFNMEENQKKF